MNNSLLIIIPLLVAFLTVSLLHPHIVKIARMKNIVDNPNVRKLQKEPVPILGGIVVFFGICLGIACVYGFYDCSSLFMVFAAMMIMLYTGTMDDILSLKPLTRFLVQIAAVGLLIFSRGYCLDNLHGLWGIYTLPDWAAIPLTLFACVGIINAMNLIDGVDGLSSGYCLVACIPFCIVFSLGETNFPMVILALATIGALIPFFLHNVFGKQSKMFIGDGGTLVMGIIMSVFVMRTIQSHGVKHLLVDHGYSSVAFALAVLAIPIFDTLRVMTVRMWRHNSPFHPDKTHLHHLFIELGCSHIITTICIITLNILIVLLWFLSGYLEGSAEWQVGLVILLGLFFTSGIYGGFMLFKRYYPSRFQQFAEFNHRVRPRREGIYLTLQKWIDRV